MSKLQGVIFDLDGTLIDSAPDIATALNATLAEYGRRALTVEEVAPLLGDGIHVTLARAQKATGAEEPDQIDRWVETFTRHYYRLIPDAGQVYPHVREALAALGKAGIKLGVCTNKLEASTLRLLDRLKLRDYFGFVAGADTFPVHKPHPGHVQGVVDGLHLTNDACVMVGDSPNDVLAAKGCGVATIVVTQGYGEGMEKYGADAIIGGFDELLAALERVGFEIKP